ncbi:MAG: HlyD family efflux transporter periplasmic adaptor subunit [Lachnospiraceae bacterium]|nr:HlyD family efflux transporter periplasmic adaptor subunit [Lachnospiraceae bacterium]
MTTERKEKIKNIAIIFLIIMLILTLFSNTFMNRSLVEVSTQRVVSDSLTSKVRGSGYVESSDGYSVNIKETRKIATVGVKTGSDVEKGDVLFTLEDAESEELVAKRAEVATAEQAYEVAVLQAGLTVEQRNNIEAGRVSSINEKLTQKAAAQAAVDAAQATVDKLNAAAISSSGVDTTAEVNKLNAAKQAELKASEAVTNAEDALALARSQADDAKAEWDRYKAYDNGTQTPPTGCDVAAGLAAAEAAYNDALANITAKNAALTSAKQALVPYSQATADAQTALSNKTAAAENSELKKAEAALEAAKANLTQLSSAMETEINLSYQYANLKTLRADLAELEAGAVGAEITSPIAGTVTEITYTAGQTVPAGETMMVIQPENMGMTLKFTITAEQAKKIKVGDEAKVVNNWYGDDINARVTAIKKNTADKSQCEVVCEMSGEDVNAGDNYTLSIGERSANYDLIVPTSSIREDSNGKFILIIESKSTPLGNRYYARRVDVEVIASDDTNSAISGALEGYEYVITTTTKPVEPNQQVRFTESGW